MWCAVKDYPNYEVSSTGDVRSLGIRSTRNRGKLLKPHPIKEGYLQVKLYNDIGSKMFLIHRLVGTHFLEKIEDCDIDHIDRKRENNCVENLRWVSKTVNIKHRDYWSIKKDGLHNIRKSWNTYQVKFVKDQKIIFCHYTHDIDEAIKIRDEYISNNPK
jgi:hypothetical protein